MLSFAVTSVAGQRSSSYASPVRQSAAAPPKEDLTVKVALNQIVEVVVPFNTPRARAIRTHLNTHFLAPDGQRALIFRGLPVPAWTNIHKESTPTQPMVTMEPTVFCEKLMEIVPLSEDIGEVKFVDEHGKPIKYEDIRSFEFVPLEVTGQSAVTRVVMPKEGMQQDKSTGARVTMDAIFVKLCQMTQTIQSTSTALKKVAEKLGLNDEGCSAENVVGAPPENAAEKELSGEVGATAELNASVEEAAGVSHETSGENGQAVFHGKRQQGHVEVCTKSVQADTLFYLFAEGVNPARKRTKVVHR